MAKLTSEKIWILQGSLPSTHSMYKKALLQCNKGVKALFVNLNLSVYYAARGYQRLHSPSWLNNKLQYQKWPLHCGGALAPRLQSRKSSATENVYMRATTKYFCLLEFDTWILCDWLYRAAKMSVNVNRFFCA